MKEIIRILQHRIYQENQDNRIVICGAGGKGKSWRALRLAQLLDPNFDIYKQLVFKATRFLDMLENEEIQKGQVIIWDEVGIEAMHRNYFTEINKSILSAFELMRHRNFTTILTLPGLDLLDASLRKLLNTYIECVHVDKERNTCLCKVMNLQYNPRLGQLYYKYFRVRGSDGKPFIASTVYIDAPSKELTDLYEPIAKEYKMGKYKQLREKITKIEEDENREWGKPKDYKKEIEFAQKNKKEFNGKYTPANIRRVLTSKGFPISHAGAKIIISSLGE